MCVYTHTHTHFPIIYLSLIGKSQFMMKHVENADDLQLIFLWGQGGDFQYNQ